MGGRRIGYNGGIAAAPPLAPGAVREFVMVVGLLDAGVRPWAGVAARRPTGDRRPATGDRRPATGDRRP
ncbi:MAG: hypothetical protein OXP11_00575, partial [Gammaproteobacteria bacterium]|nr:hypothetical protein [Gammaproteobacteria bacterium]